MRISDWSSDVCSSDLAVPEGLALLTHILRHGELLGELVVDVAGPGTSTSLRDRAEQRQHELVMCRPAAQPGLLLGLVPGLDTPAAGGQRRLGWIFPGHAACCVAPERERRAMTAWLADSGVG